MSAHATVPTLPRSFLYVPGDRLDLVRKAARGEADAVLLDLEDAVAPARRPGARSTVATWLASAPRGMPQWWVRVDGEALAEDLPAAVTGSVAGLVVAKGTPAALLDAAAILDDLEAQRGLAPGSIGLVCLVESAAAFGALHEIAHAPRVLTLALGEADLFGDLRLTRGPATEAAVDALRLQVVLACAAAGLAAPVAPTSTAYRDLEAFARTSAGLRDLGFRSRTAVHPAQVPVINEAFTPTQEEFSRAQQALEAYEASGGAVTSAGGHLVDAATVKASREVVARARLGS